MRLKLISLLRARRDRPSFPVRVSATEVMYSSFWLETLFVASAAILWFMIAYQLLLFSPAICTVGVMPGYPDPAPGHGLAGRVDSGPGAK